MHVGDFPYFNVSIDRDGLVALDARARGRHGHRVPSRQPARARHRWLTTPGLYGLVWVNPREPDAARTTRRAPRRARIALPGRQAASLARWLPPRRPDGASHHRAAHRARPAGAHPLWPPHLHAAVEHRGADPSLPRGAHHPWPHGPRQHRVHQRRDRCGGAQPQRVSSRHRACRCTRRSARRSSVSGPDRGPVRLGHPVPSPDGGAREGARERPVVGSGIWRPGREWPSAVLRQPRRRRPSSRETHQQEENVHDRAIAVAPGFAALSAGVVSPRRCCSQRAAPAFAQSPAAGSPHGQQRSPRWRTSRPSRRTTTAGTSRAAEGARPRPTSIGAELEHGRRLRLRRPDPDPAPARRRRRPVHHRPGRWLQHAAVPSSRPTTGIPVIVYDRPDLHRARTSSATSRPTASRAATSRACSRRP